MFPDVTQAGTSCIFDGFRSDGDWGKEREWFRPVESKGDGNDGGDRLEEETSGRRGLVEKYYHTARRIDVNSDVDVATHCEHSSLSRDGRYKCTSIIASKTFRVTSPENFKAGSLHQILAKITMTHLKDLRR